MTQTPTNASRAEFEVWLHNTQSVLLTARDDDDDYVDFCTHMAWRAWQAAQSQPTIPEGMVLVPREPTAYMVSAGAPEMNQYGAMYAEACYRAMIAAAPKAPE